MTNPSNRRLRLTPYAWAKLLYLRDLGNSEVGGFGISSADDLLLIEDLCLIKQFCTEVTVRFCDDSVADFFDAQIDVGLPPQRFARIWTHTHPGKSPHPSKTDEETFQRCFGDSDWAVMFILARGGQTYARLRLNAGPGGELILPVEVDFTSAFAAAHHSAWQQEYQQSVQIEQPLATLPWSERLRTSSISRSPDQNSVRRDPYLADPFWDDQAFHLYMESIDDRDRHPF